jgi:hypothetical protein
MRVVLNLAIAACLLALAGVNLLTNPFLPEVTAQEGGCAGSPPSPDCGCCDDCGCWVCP